MKRKAENYGTNSTATTDGLIISQHVDPNDTTSTCPSAIADVDTRQNPSLGGQFAGYIFLCNARTKPDCFTYRVVGLPASRIDVVEKIKPDAKLFLFDFDVKLLYGPYVADSARELALEPYAIGGKFPAQVKFSIADDYLPLAEAAFKDAIKENYLSKSKFKQDLSYEQVNKLVSLFRPIILQPPQQASVPFHNVTRHDSSMNAFQRSLQGPSGPGSVPNDVLRHPSYRYVQEVPLFQRALTRGGEIISVPHHAYERYESARPNQPYHPDDPSIQQRYTHLRYGYTAEPGINPVVPPAISYYDKNGRCLSTINPPQLHDRKDAPAVALCLTPPYWIDVAARTQSPQDQSSSYNLSSRYGPGRGDGNLHHRSNYTELSRGYHNQGYPGTHEAVVTPTEQPVYAHSYYDNTSSTGLSYGRGYQQHRAPYQTQPVTVHQEVATGYTYGIQEYPNSQVFAPTDYVHGNQEHPNSQVSAPVGSAGPNDTMIAGYRYQDQGYTSYSQAVPVTDEQVASDVPVYTHDKHPASCGDNYAQSQGVSTLPQALPSGGGVVVDNAYSYNPHGY